MNFADYQCAKCGAKLENLIHGYCPKCRELLKIDQVEPEVYQGINGSSNFGFEAKKFDPYTGLMFEPEIKRSIG